MQGMTKTWLSSFNVLVCVYMWYTAESDQNSFQLLRCDMFSSSLGQLLSADQN